MKEDHRQTSYEIKSGVRDLARWFNSTAGRYLLELEHERIAWLLPDIFGYHILQVGGVINKQMLASSRINHKLVSSAIVDPETGNTPDLFCVNGNLPIASESIDVVVLPHVLEFESQPHQLLRETERVLIGEGHVIIIGFNPVSLWGLWRLFLRWRQSPPWSSNTISLPRARDWLTLLDFEIIRTEQFFFRPPASNEKLMHRINFLEQLGCYCWPWLGNAYLILARKRVESMTPIKLKWQMRRRLIASDMIEPSA